MTTLHRGLTKEDLDKLINFSLESDLTGYYDEDDPEFNAFIERVVKAQEDIDKDKSCRHS